MRVGLVLGAGGVIGGSWLMGALEALEAETGWHATDAEQIVGTSAGAVIGALAAAGVPPEYMSAYADGRGPRRRRGGRGARRRHRCREGRARERRRVPPAVGLPADRSRVVAPGDVDAPPAAPPLARRAPRRVAAARLHLDRADPWRRRHVRRRGLAVEDALLGRRRRLRQRPPGGVRPRGRAARDGGRGRRRVVCDPRLLPPGQDRRPPVRRRRDLLGLEPRPALRRGPRPRHLPQPDVLARAGHRRLPGRPDGGDHARRRRPPPRPRGAQAPRGRHARPDPAAGRAGRRAHGLQPHERRPPPRGHGAGAPERRDGAARDPRPRRPAPRPRPPPGRRTPRPRSSSGAARPARGRRPRAA